MGYELHITRADDWTRSSSAPILLEEWLEYVKADPEMRLDGYAEASTSDGQTLRYESDGLAVWVAYSQHGAGGGMAWFDHRDGEVVVKNPDDELISKMCRVAERLGARVQGDDGELYPLPAEPYADGRGSSTARENKTWWRKVFAAIRGDAG